MHLKFDESMKKINKLIWFSNRSSGTDMYVGVMVFNATFNNISVISWQSVLIVEESGVSGENHQPVASHWQILSHNVVLITSRHEQSLNSQLLWW
jgi:hypothetical protein